MKFLHSAAYALIASQLSSAAPAADASTSVIEYRSINEAHAARVALQEGISCLFLKKLVHRIGTSGATVMFVSLGGDLAEAVCIISGAQHCDVWGRAIRIALSMIYLVVSNRSGAIPETSPVKREIDHDAVVGWWEGVLAGGELSFDSIDIVPFNASDATLARRDGDPRLLSRIRLSGLVDRETGFKHNIVANHFEGDKTVLHLPAVEQESVVSGAGGSLSKRANGRGFKISYTTRVPTKLTTRHQEDMADYLADEWVSLTRQYQTDDVIGFATVNHNANFYYRIIPETTSFGLNYESVDVCGGMSSYI